jgi:hypothetical protein
LGTVPVHLDGHVALHITKKKENDEEISHTLSFIASDVMIQNIYIMQKCHCNSNFHLDSWSSFVASVCYLRSLQSARTDSSNVSFLIK